MNFGYSSQYSSYAYPTSSSTASDLATFAQPIYYVNNNNNSNNIKPSTSNIIQSTSYIQHPTISSSSLSYYAPPLIQQQHQQQQQYHSIVHTSASMDAASMLLQPPVSSISLSHSLDIPRVNNSDFSIPEGKASSHREKLVADANRKLESCFPNPYHPNFTSVAFLENLLYYLKLRSKLDENYALTSQHLCRLCMFVPTTIETLSIIVNNLGYPLISEDMKQSTNIEPERMTIAPLVEYPPQVQPQVLSSPPPPPPPPPPPAAMLDYQHIQQQILSATAFSPDTTSTPSTTSPKPHHKFDNENLPLHHNSFQSTINAKSNEKFQDTNGSIKAEPQQQSTLSTSTTPLKQQREDTDHHGAGVTSPNVIVHSSPPQQPPPPPPPPPTSTADAMFPPPSASAISPLRGTPLRAPGANYDSLWHGPPPSASFKTSPKVNSMPTEKAVSPPMKPQPPPSFAIPPMPLSPPPPPPPAIVDPSATVKWNDSPLKDYRKQESPPGNPTIPRLFLEIAGEKRVVSDSDCPVVIGRDPGRLEEESSIITYQTDFTVSKRHCEIIFDSVLGCFCIRSLSKTNKTRVTNPDSSVALSENEMSDGLVAGSIIVLGMETSVVVQRVIGLPGEAPMPQPTISSTRELESGCVSDAFRHAIMQLELMSHPPNEGGVRKHKEEVETLFHAVLALAERCPGKTKNKGIAGSVEEQAAISALSVAEELGHLGRHDWVNIQKRHAAMAKYKSIKKQIFQLLL